MIPYRVLIADDHPRARQAIRSLLEAEPDFAVAGEACGGREAVRLAEQLSPDIVLMDIRMPDISGLEAVRLIRRRCPQIRVVMLTVSDDVADLFTALQFGAQGYLLKNMDPDDWIAYLRSLPDDNPETSRRLADRLFYRFRSVQDPDEPLPSVLTPREREILTCVATGDNNRQIAERLSIAENTVKNHIKNILEKLSLDNRVQLTSYAVRHGLSQYSQDSGEK
jgi:DNA-binding NarL/FixJ family response regulator